MSLPLAFIPGMTGGWELLLILALVLLLFGPKRLPEIAEAMGKSIRKFKSATQSATDEVKREIDEAGRAVNGTGEPEKREEKKRDDEPRT